MEQEKTGASTPASKSKTASTRIPQPEPIVPLWWWSAIYAKPRYRFNALGVAMMISRHRDYGTNTLSTWGQKAIGKHLGLSEKRIGEAITVLEEAGILSVKNCGPKPPIYTLRYEALPANDGAKALPATDGASSESSPSARTNALPAAGQKLSQPPPDNTPPSTPINTHDDASFEKNEEATGGDDLLAILAEAFDRYGVPDKPSNKPARILKQIGAANVDALLVHLDVASARDNVGNPLAYALWMLKEGIEPDTPSDPCDKIPKTAGRHFKECGVCGMFHVGRCDDPKPRVFREDPCESCGSNHFPCNCCPHGAPISKADCARMHVLTNSSDLLRSTKLEREQGVA